MTHELSGKETTVNDASETGIPSDQFDNAPDPAPVYRNQRKRYPWWVKSVNEPTTVVDRDKQKPMDRERLTLDLVGRFYHKKNRADVVKKTANLGLLQYIG